MPSAPVQIPPAFASSFMGADELAWVAALPRLVADLVEEWQLEVDGDPTHGVCALVVPVRTPSGRPAALKVTWPHWEAEHEHLALRAWDGAGAVRLLRADPHRFAMLLERLHREDLTTTWDVQACEEIGGLLRRLHVPPPPSLRRQSRLVADLGERLRAGQPGLPVPRRLVEQAVSIARGLVEDPDLDRALVHTDLHYENVLAADREPWLAIDPKPLAGDPHCEAAPVLLNRFEETAGDVRRALRARFHAVVDAAGLEEDRARDWVVLRCVQHVLEEVEEAGAERPDHDLVTMCVAVAKAVQR